MKVKIACHPGFCLFQPVKKEYSIISANNTILAKLKELPRKAGNLVTKAKYSAKTAVRTFATTSYSFA